MNRRVLLLFCLLAPTAHAQVGGRVTVGTFATRPTACSAGDLYVTSDTNLIYQCEPANTWTMTPKLNAANAFTGNNTHGGTETFKNINNVLWVDGINFISLASCYAALPSTGGICMVPPNYSETLAANIVLKTQSGFIFTGPAVITMGSFQVTMDHTVSDVFIRGPVIAGTPNGGGGIQTPVVLRYTGTGHAFSIGDNTAETGGVAFDNIAVDIGGAGSNAVAWYFTQIRMYEMNNPVCEVQNSTTGQICIVLDGGSVFTGLGIIRNPIFSNAPFNGIKFVSGANVNTIVNGSFINGCATGGIGLNFVNAAGNVVVDMDVESCPTAVAFASNANDQDNVVSMANLSNTVDVSFGALSNNNQVTALLQNPIVSGSVGGGNRVIWAGNNYNTPSAATAASIGATTMVTPASATTYRLQAYPTVTALGVTCTGNTTLVFNVTYNDPFASGTVTTASTAINLAVGGNGVVGTTAAGANAFPPFFFRVKAGTAVRYSTTYTAGANCAPGPSYQVFPTLEPEN